MTEAARYVTERSLIEESAPALVRFLAQIAARFGLVVSQKVAAQAVPVLGALGGAAANAAFMDHFQSIARAHFTVRRLRSAPTGRERCARSTRRSAARSARERSRLRTIRPPFFQAEPPFRARTRRNRRAAARHIGGPFLQPAIWICRPPPRGIALLRAGLHGVAPEVVCREPGRKAALRVAILMHGHQQRQARADLALARRPTDAEVRKGDDPRQGRVSRSPTRAAWLRSSLIGQQPSPTASAARIHVLSAIAASPTALKNRSR